MIKRRGGDLTETTCTFATGDAHPVITRTHAILSKDTRDREKESEKDGGGLCARITEAARSGTSARKG